MKYFFHFCFLFFITVIAGQSFAADESRIFSDIQGTPSSTAVQFLSENGIIEGFSDGTFRPEKTITRAEFLKIALLSHEQDLSPECEPTKTFLDVSPEDWFFPFVCSAVNRGVVEGYDDGTFRPHDPINIRDSAKILVTINAIPEEAKGKEWHESFTSALVRDRIFPGSVSDFGSLLKRGEMAQMVWGINTGNEVENTSFGELPSIANCAELEVQLRKFQKRQQREGTPYIEKSFGTLEGAVDMVASSVMDQTNEESSQDFSGTNIQEEGVDEADIIKNDGSHIFLVKNQTIRIIKAYPSEELQEVSTISLENEGFTPQDMFLDGDRLTVIGNTYNNSYYDFEKTIDENIVQNPTESVSKDSFTDITDTSTSDFNGISFPEREMIKPMPDRRMYKWQGQNTIVIVYDISDRSDPKKIRTVTHEGRYLSSRRIEGTVYVVLSRDNYTWDIPIPFDPAPYIPLMEDTLFSAEDLNVSCSDIRYFPNFTSPNELIVVGVPIQDVTQKAFREVVLGGGEQVYASLENLFVTRSIWNEHYFEQNETSGWNSSEETEFYRFHLEPDSISFTGKGTAEGRILNQFSMSEYNDFFRIATQVGQAWGSELSETMVTIFDKDLKKIGYIDEIAPGENMKSARFLENRAYLVTFKTVDPLFVLDVNPENPKILGKLKIPGWSDYLHPWGENHLLGFGKEVDESIDADKIHSDSAIYYTAVLGMKLSLFDISDLSDPKEIHKTVIGYRDTTSEMLTNHKALLADLEKGIIGFPVTITENKNNISGYEADIETVFSGARVYDVSAENGFTLRGSATHYASNEDFLKSGDYFYGDPDYNINRILYIGDTFYTVSPNIIKALSWDDLSEKKTITLD